VGFAGRELDELPATTSLEAFRECRLSLFCLCKKRQLEPSEFNVSRGIAWVSTPSWARMPEKTCAQSFGTGQSTHFGPCLSKSTFLGIGQHMKLLFMEECGVLLFLHEW
jgi:hypothetical protein